MAVIIGRSVQGALKRLKSWWVMFICIFLHRHRPRKVSTEQEQQQQQENHKETKEQWQILPEEIVRLFRLLDRDLDGLVSRNDINQILADLDLPDRLHEAELGDGDQVGLDGFLGLWNGDEDRDVNSDEVEDLREVFAVFDRDGDGFICASELQHILTQLGLMKMEYDVGSCQRMISSFDANFDGKLDFSEFKHMMLLP